LFQSDVEVPPPTDDQRDCATVVAAEEEDAAVSSPGVSVPGSDVSPDMASGIPFGVRRRLRRNSHLDCIHLQFVLVLVNPINERASPGTRS
jgi:hypothetical protein